MTDSFVFMVRHHQDDEIHLFAKAKDADAYAGLFLGCEATEEPLLDANFVEEVRADLEIES